MNQLSIFHCMEENSLLPRAMVVNLFSYIAASHFEYTQHTS